MPTKSILLFILTALFANSCQEKDISLMNSFWNPPPDVNALYKNGADKVEVLHGIGQEEAAKFIKEDTSLLIRYRDGKLFYENLEFNTPDAEKVLNSLALAHGLTTYDTPDTTANFIAYFFEDDKSFYHAFAEDKHITIQRFFSEKK